MSTPVPVTSTADYKTVSSPAVQFDTSMDTDEYWVFTPSVACFIAQGSNPTASAGDGSTYVAAGESVLIHGYLGAKLSVIRASSDGVATLTRAHFPRD